MQIVRVDAQLCNGCGQCVQICPVDVFRMSENGKSEPTYASDCHVCHHCEEECPTRAIAVFEEVRTEHNPSVYDHRGLVLAATDWSALQK